jgi:ATP-dependent DNA ligase
MMAEKTSKEESMQMATAETTAMTKRRRKEHPHFCLFDILHLTVSKANNM